MPTPSTGAYRIKDTPTVYRIRHLPTGHVYIGSTRRWTVRFADHFGRLQDGEHRNPKLQEAWTRDGYEAFVFEVICFLPSPATDEELGAREMEEMGKIPMAELFNVDTRVDGQRFLNISKNASKATGRNNAGRKLSPEHAAKLAEARAKIPKDPLTGKYLPKDQR